MTTCLPSSTGWLTCNRSAARGHAVCGGLHNVPLGTGWAAALHGGPCVACVFREATRRRGRLRRPPTCVLQAEAQGLLGCSLQRGLCGAGVGLERQLRQPWAAGVDSGLCGTCGSAERSCTCCTVCQGAKSRGGTGERRPPKGIQVQEAAAQRRYPCPCSAPPLELTRWLGVAMRRRRCRNPTESGFQQGLRCRGYLLASCVFDAPFPTCQGATAACKWAHALDKGPI